MASVATKCHIDDWGLGNHIVLEGHAVAGTYAATRVHDVIWACAAAKSHLLSITLLKTQSVLMSLLLLTMSRVRIGLHRVRPAPHQL